MLRRVMTAFPADSRNAGWTPRSRVRRVVGAEVVTPGLVTVSLGKRPMQSADTSHGTSVAGREPGGAPSGPPSGGHFQRNSDAVIPKARSRAARLCLGGRESRNRQSGGDPLGRASCRERVEESVGGVGR